MLSAVESIVHDAIDGLLVTNSSLSRLDGYPAIKVVLRRQWDASKVAVISGGGSGHEPAHAGFVGEGMLTAAVCGEIFASPSVDAVHAAIRAVAAREGVGCILIVKNYTGDRLTFGLASERARSEGIPCQMVVVADDVALPHVKQPRGIAGTLFVHKLAGFMSQRGDSLSDIHSACTLLAASVRSIGIALSECTIPGRARAAQRLAPGEAELGMGIHGEAGASKIAVPSLRETVSMMLARLELAPTGRFAMLVNNLGACSVLEMQCIAHEVSIACQQIALIMVGSFMTSLDMHGFSFSVVDLSVASLWEEAFMAPVHNCAWSGMNRIHHRAPVRLLSAPQKVIASGTEGDMLRDQIRSVCEALLAAEQDLNSLDSVVGDGDTGATIASGCKAVLAALPTMDTSRLGPALRHVADVISTSMGGSSGVLLSIFLTAVSDALRSDGNVWNALKHGVSRVSFYGGARIGDRTALDAMIPAFECRSLQEAFEAAVRGARNTSEMASAGAGRSAYVGAEVLLGTEDPGAAAVAIAIKALLHTIKQ